MRACCFWISVSATCDGACTSSFSSDMIDDWRGGQLRMDQVPARLAGTSRPAGRHLDPDDDEHELL